MSDDWFADTREMILALEREVAQLRRHILECHKTVVTSNGSGHVGCICGLENGEIPGREVK